MFAIAQKRNKRLDSSGFLFVWRWFLVPVDVDGTLFLTLENQCVAFVKQFSFTHHVKDTFIKSFDPQELGPTKGASCNLGSLTAF